MSFDVASTSAASSCKRFEPLQATKRNKSQELGDRLHVQIFTFFSLGSLAKAACVSHRWKNIAGWGNERLWSFLKFEHPKLITFDEKWWRANVDCIGLGLDPAGTPSLSKASLKASVIFLKRVFPLLNPGEHLLDLTLPKGLTHEICDKIGKLSLQRLKEGKFAAPLSPELFYCTLIASLNVNSTLDHTRLSFRKEGTGMDKAVRLFIATQSFILSEKSTDFLIPYNAKVRPLPLDYDLTDRNDIWNAAQSGYPWDLSDPYLRFSPGTVHSHRVEFFARPNFCEWLALRIASDEGGNYSHQSFRS